MKLKILLVGNESPCAIENSYKKYLALESEISALQIFPAQNIFLEYYENSILHKLLYRLGFSRILHRINKQLIDQVNRFLPDVLLVFKGMEIFPETLKCIRSRGVRVVNYNPDNPFVFSGRGSGNSNVTESIRHFDLYISYDKEVCRRLVADYGVRAALVPFGYELNPVLFEKCKYQEEIRKACFIGNPDPERLRFLNQLASLGIEIDVYGHFWEKFRLNGNISPRGYAADEMMWINLRRYRIQLNLMRIHNPASHNMRTFEIPAIGGIQLAPETPDHLSFFQSGKEIFLFENEMDCAEKIRMLLSLDPDEALRIRVLARERCLHSGYSYEHRAREIFNHIRLLFAVESI